MARYEDEFMGYYSDAGTARGADPNYRGGAYRGMRRWAGPGQAAYGDYRAGHPMDFQSAGGYYGRYGRDFAYSGEMGSGHGRAYDREWQGGGVHDPRYDAEYLRDFNAYSPRFQREGRDRSGRRPSYDMPYGGHPHDRLSGRYRDPRLGYGNRGLASGGYSEGWAWGPMRGSR